MGIGYALENWLLLSDELVEFEEQPVAVEVEDCRKIAN